MLRSLSLLIRGLQGKKEVNRTLERFNTWRNELPSKPLGAQNRRLLLIRLDDIGDYLLFRNTLPAYKAASCFQGHEIHLLGNSAWKDIFSQYDASHVDHIIWLDKHKYFAEKDYRTQMWAQLSAIGFEKTIATSRSRSLLLDDLCMLAAGAPTNVGSNNNLVYQKLNEVSDRLYNRLYAGDSLQLEFFYNCAFAAWCIAAPFTQPRPHITINASVVASGMVCFVGGSKKSHLWPNEKWVQLVLALQKGDKAQIIIAGGPGDADFAHAIAAQTQADNRVGKLSLVELTHLFAGARLVITHDTMASHLAISLGIPTVIIANGDNFQRFCAYQQAGIAGVRAVYPSIFLQQWKQNNFNAFSGYKAVTSDLKTIPVHAVEAAIRELLGL